MLVVKMFGTKMFTADMLVATIPDSVTPRQKNQRLAFQAGRGLQVLRP